MATAQNFIVYDASTVANYVSFGQTISNALTTCGFTKTTDTGQVAWGSVTTLPTSNAFRDYEIWKPSDSLQTGSTQFFVKVEYAQNSSSSPSVRLSIGQGSNGSGTLTGNVVGPFVPIASAGSMGASTTFECDFAGDGSGTGRFGCILYRGTDHACAFGWERTLDSSGIPNSEGVTLISVSTNSANNNFAQTNVFGVGAANSSHPYRIINQGNVVVTDVFNGLTPISPWYPSYGKFGNAQTIFAWARYNDVAEGLSYTATLYGSAHPYMASKSSNGPTSGSLEAFMLRND